MHMTFVFKQYAQYQYSNNISRWMTSMFNPNEPIKRRFRMTIIVKLCPMKFVMYEIDICYDYQLIWFLYYVGWRKCHEHF